MDIKMVRDILRDYEYQLLKALDECVFQTTKIDDDFSFIDINCKTETDKPTIFQEEEREISKSEYEKE